MVLQMLGPVFLLTCSVLVTCARKERAEVFCTLGGQRYEMGQTWHPTLKPFGENACINCTCHKGGEVKCQAIDCPRPVCDEPKIPEGECCPTCDIGNERSKEEDDQKPGCDFDGKSFKDGDVFPSNSTGLRPTRKEQCVMCVCAMGKIFCQLKTCLPTKCKKFKNVPHDCCPQCADKAEFTGKYPGPILSDPKQNNKTDADCTSAMGLHLNGSSWNPVIGVYGVVECIVCSCFNSNVTCERIECPPVDSLPCKEPVKGPCCKQCSRRRKNKLDGHEKTTADQDKGRSTAEDGGQKKKGGKRGKGKKRRKNRRKKERGQSHRKCRAADEKEVHPERKASLTFVATVFSQLCLPRRMDRLVYRSKGDNYEMLTFDSVTDQSVEMLRWAVENGTLQDMERKLVRADEFREKTLCSQIMGATNKRGFKKLLQKIDSKLRSCQSQNRHCTVKTLDMVIQRDRRLKPLPTKRVCGE